MTPEDRHETPATPPAAELPRVTPASPAAARQRGLAGMIGRLVGRWYLWAGFVVFMMTWPIVRGVTAKLPDKLPVLGVVPEFELTDQHGQAFGSRQLRGRIWVANFIFTRCPTVCPTFSKKMFQIQHRGRNLGEALHLVSFTVDPEYDTPAVLADYAHEYRASARAWSFLTGPLQTVKTAVMDGLKVAMGNDDPAGGFMQIFHGEHFVLVDRDMQIRGYYRATEADAVDKVLQGAGLLANRGE